MHDRQRLKLLHGPYAPPQVQRGDRLEDKARGKVKVLGYSDSPIPWPYCHRSNHGYSLILCGDLIRAVQCESEIAIAAHWGVSVTTVWKWRKALGVAPITEGTERLYRAYQPEKLPEPVAERGREGARQPEAREKISRAKTGQPASPGTKAALLEAAKRPKSEQWKAQLSARNRARGHRPPPPHPEWTKDEDRRLRQLVVEGLTDREIAQRIGRPLHGVRCRRRALGVKR